ncbi:DUF3850 domain-containing protein [Enterococcus sp. LJL51]|uniref:DUF3850 domain-containing protein n=1 Tax=Enterococcus sp. LJL51 TaxID=3416656 RepID=UPI003CF77075
MSVEMELEVKMLEKEILKTERKLVIICERLRFYERAAKGGLKKRIYMCLYNLIPVIMSGFIMFVVGLMIYREWDYFLFHPAFLASEIVAALILVVCNSMLVDFSDKSLLNNIIVRKKEIICLENDLKKIMIRRKFLLEKNMREIQANIDYAYPNFKSKCHDLKILPEFFKEALLGVKPFEIRKNDRNFEKGDFVKLHEFDGTNFTGRFIFGQIMYVTPFSQKNDNVVFSYEQIMVEECYE